MPRNSAGAKPWTRSPVRPEMVARATRRLALPLLVLLSACGSGPRQPSFPRVPPLPLEARQPAIPSECLPTCLDALMSARESWLNTPTVPASPALPASGPTRR